MPVAQASTGVEECDATEVEKWTESRVQKIELEILKLLHEVSKNSLGR
jgi:hypothetical protein